MHVKDVVRALLDLSLKAPSGTVVNLGDEQTTSINEIVQMLRDMFNADFKIRYDASKPTGRKIKSVSSVLLRRILPDFTQEVSLQEGLNEMKGWYDRHKAMGNF